MKRKDTPKVVLIAIVALLLSACSATKGYLKQGNYDAAVNAAAHKLMASKNKQKEILYLEEAFAKANKQDLDRAMILKKEGNPGNWGQIYETYARIRKRQQLVQPLLPLFIKKEFRNANVVIVNVDQELVEAKKNAAEYLYSSGNMLLAAGDKKSAREAWARYNEACDYYANYKDIRDKMNEAYAKGKVYIKVTTLNDSKIIMPEEFEADIKKINTSGLNQFWEDYHTTPNPNVTYDFDVVLKIKKIDITPERVSENNVPFSKSIQDGWTYVYDKRGNVVKDSLGNDIKNPKFITVTAVVKQGKQNKMCMMAGEIVVVNSNTKQQITSTTFNEQVVFDNNFAVYTGDKRAISPEMMRQIGGGPIPFPPDGKMIMDNSSAVKGRLQNFLNSNTALFLN
jgi:tetratricopeptide (TPR) repeat protein